MFKKYNKSIILLGALMLLSGLLFMMEPYYTWAVTDQDNGDCAVELDVEIPLFQTDNMNPGDTYESSVTVTKIGTKQARLYFTWEKLHGDLDFYEIMDMTIWIDDGDPIHTGKMSEWLYNGDPDSDYVAYYITNLSPGESVVVNFIIHLPGLETGNEFQGASATSRLVFYTVCSGTPPPPPPPPPVDFPAINIEKLTNGFDADDPTGPQIEVGDDVVWTYIVTNNGDVPLSNVVVTDNIAGVSPVYVSGDMNSDGIMQVGEVWIFEASGVAIEGQYANIGTVVGTPPGGQNVTDTDPSHYFGVLTPTEEEFPPAEPEVEPEDEGDDSVIIIAPEAPLTDLPLPRTDGTSIALLLVGLLLLMAGFSLRKSEQQIA